MLDVLHLEDSPLDAELVGDALRAAGFEGRVSVVASSEAFLRLLDEQRFDLVLADYSLPDYDGSRALADVRRRDGDVPFIFVSGTLGEDVAIDSLKRGATDYVVKQRLDRLGAAVARALDEAAERRERRRAEEALSARERQFRAVFDGSHDAMLIVGDGRAIVDANPSASHLLGRTREELLALSAEDLADNRDVAIAAWEAFRASGRQRGESRFSRPDGEVRDVEYSATADILPGLHLSILRDVTERKREERSRQASEARLRILAQAAGILAEALDLGEVSRGIASLLLDQFGTVSTIDLVSQEKNLFDAEPANVAPARLLGTDSSGTGEDPRDAVVRTRVPMLLRVEETEGRVVREPGPRSRMFVPLIARGAVLGVLTAASSERMYDEEDLALVRELAARTAIAIDNVRLFSAAQDLRQRAEDANREKDHFLAMVSHELRTPLNAMLGWTRMLREGGLDKASQLKALETIERNAHAQTRLIEDLLDVSRIITGNLLMTSEPVEMSAVVEAALDALGPTVRAKGLKLEASVAPGLPTFVGDARRIQQVVWNLLSNAVKFTPQGGRVSVTVSSIQTDVAIVVEDSGRGISPAFLPHVFERFRQENSGATRAAGGVGLGLSIVKQLVELHGGVITAHSAGEGQGATFEVRLPIQRDLTGARGPPLR